MEPRQATPPTCTCDASAEVRHDPREARLITQIADRLPRCKTPPLGRRCPCSQQKTERARDTQTCEDAWYGPIRTVRPVVEGGATVPTRTLEEVST